MKKVMIIAGEQSGDMHGANLVRAMLRKDTALRFFGMGGKEMAAAGVELLFDMQRVSVVGLVEVVTHFSDILSARKTLVQALKSHKPDLLIVIDFPDFNFHMAGQAKKHGVPVFYYIAPQVWAWRESRVHKINTLSDGIGVILPFEEQFFKERGVKAEYVGHPLIDTVCSFEKKEDFFNTRNLEMTDITLCLLPGSRRKEVKNLLCHFCRGAAKIQKKTGEKITVLVPKAASVSILLLMENGLQELKNNSMIQLHIEQDDRYAAMAASDACMATSGTVTLELALLRVPMVVSYITSPVTYYVGRLIITMVKYFSLPNLIAKAPFITELLQNEVTPERLSSEIYGLLKVEKKKKLAQSGYDDVCSQLGSGGASEKAAALAFSVMDN